MEGGFGPVRKLNAGDVVDAFDYGHSALKPFSQIGCGLLHVVEVVG